MRFVPAVLLAFTVAGCAHSLALQPREGHVVSVSAAATTVVLRYEPEDDAIARQVQRALRAAIPVASRWGTLPSRITVTIHPTHEALELAARRPGQAWLRAWARRDSVEVQSPRTWSRGEATDAELAQLLAHEFTHCVLAQALGSAAHRGQPVPFWFWEGMATTNAGEHFPAVRPATGRAPTVNVALDPGGPPMTYAAADTAFRFLLQRHGDEAIRQLVARLRDGAEFPDAFQDVMGLRVEAFERELDRVGREEGTRG